MDCAELAWRIAPVALAVLDADGKPLAGNDALTELLGADAAALWSATVGVGPVALARMVALLAEQPSVEVATRLRAGASDERDVRLAARRGEGGEGGNAARRGEGLRVFQHNGEFVRVRVRRGCPRSPPAA